MTPLNTHILIKYIKNCKKLQEIECEHCYRWIEAHNDYEIEIGNPKDYDQKNKKKYSATTIADVIDNAEMLFGDKEVIIGENKGDGIIEERYYIISENLLNMCFNNKSIDEISRYVVNNII